MNIPDVKLITPRRFTDSRGWFAETWSAKSLAVAFCQDNQSLSIHAGTIRGLHFQTPPHAQAKLVSVLAGRIFDVAVDLRRSSPTFGQHAAFELDADSGRQLFVPKGFAHGFCTLEPNTLVQYKVDAPYAPDADGGIYWADESLGITWPVDPANAHLSAKDAALPRLKDIAVAF